MDGAAEETVETRGSFDEPPFKDGRSKGGFPETEGRESPGIPGKGPVDEGRPAAGDACDKERFADVLFPVGPKEDFIDEKAEPVPSL